MCSDFLLNKSVLVCVSVYCPVVVSVMMGWWSSGGAMASDSCVLCGYGAAWCVYCTVCGG